MKIKTLALAVGLAVAALGSIGASGVAQAAPILQIIGGNPESIGDNGGTSYPSAPAGTPVPGAGLPTDLGGWPNNFPSPGTYPPGFALDTDLPPGLGNYGISGWDASYLKLIGLGTGTTVTFQFMGKGDAVDRNLFQLFLGGAWTTVFDTQGSHGTCGASGSSPVIDCSPAGSSVSFMLAASDLFAGDLIPFQFVNLTTPGTAINDGTNNISPEDPPYPSQGGYFLGCDPYLATGAYQDTCNAVYAGFTDRGFTAQGVGDHDYEDLIVRVSVPEPGSLLLVGAGLLGLAGLRHRKA